MNKTLQLIAISAFVIFTFLSSNAFAQIKYNPYNNSWTQNSPSSELKYNGYNNSWDYESSGSTMQYNGFDNSWDYCC
tara:strand:+ start:3212 stop:3442 length:231 start_codon:yes stop_codon:yes gene_type:complete